MSKIRTQKDFFPELSKRTGYSQKELKKIWKSVVDMTMESINNEDTTDTVLPWIGRIRARIIVGYTGRNPRTGEKIDVPVSRRLHFKFYTSFKNMIEKDFTKK